MVSPTMEVIKVKNLSQYGFFSEEGQGYSWGKFVKDTEKATVLPGATFEMVVYTGPKGGKSINKVGRQVSEGTSLPPVVAKAAAIEKADKSLGEPLGVNYLSGINEKGYMPRDFDKEARGKTFCQYMAAVLSNPSVNFDTVHDLFPMIDKCVARTFGDK